MYLIRGKWYLFFSDLVILTFDCLKRGEITFGMNAFVRIWRGKQEICPYTGRKRIGWGFWDRDFPAWMEDSPSKNPMDFSPPPGLMVFGCGRIAQYGRGIPGKSFRTRTDFVEKPDLDNFESRSGKNFSIAIRSIRISYSIEVC